MSLLAQQDIIRKPDLNMGITYSFGPSMSKRGAAGSSEAGSFLYDSPSRSYAADQTAKDKFKQPTGESEGIDGTPVMKAGETTYGKDQFAKLGPTDTTLLTSVSVPPTILDVFLTPHLKDPVLVPVSKV